MGAKIPLKYSDLAEDEARGIYYTIKKEIHMDTDAPECMQTLWHEVMHAIFDRLGASLDPVLEEILCDTCATVLIENFDVKLKLTR